MPVQHDHPGKDTAPDRGPGRRKVRQRRARGRVVLGWREWAALPELGARSIKVKLDTGARTSSLHAFKPRRFQRDGRPMIRFEIHPVQRSTASSIEVEAEVLEERTVRTSGGEAETRPVIRTMLQLGDRQFRIELTLTRRDEMGFRMLLGREALRRRVVVDPARSFVLGDADAARATRKAASKSRRKAITTGEDE